MANKEEIKKVIEGYLRTPNRYFSLEELQRNFRGEEVPDKTS